MIKEKLRTESVGTDGWRHLYKAALFEADRRKLPSRLAEAERALMLRAREPFAISSVRTEEWHAVHKGLYALRALRGCLKQNTSQSAA
jgi:hypothetical protein